MEKKKIKMNYVWDWSKHPKQCKYSSNKIQQDRKIKSKTHINAAEIY